MYLREERDYESNEHPRSVYTLFHILGMWPVCTYVRVSKHSKLEALEESGTPHRCTCECICESLPSLWNRAVLNGVSSRWNGARRDWIAKAAIERDSMMNDRGLRSATKPDSRISKLVGRWRTFLGHWTWFPTDPLIIDSSESIIRGRRSSQIRFLIYVSRQRI